MDFGSNIRDFGQVNIFDLRDLIFSQGEDFWKGHLETRKRLAGNRPGNAVFLINDAPASCPRRNLIEEARGGAIHVVHYVDDPIFCTVEKIVKTQIQPFFKKASAMRVQLATLPPGKEITPHRDMGILARIHRLHIPIITAEGVHFFVKQNRYFLEPSHLYELNNVVVHSVVNKSDVERVHLLVDMLPEEVGGISVHFDEKSHLNAVMKN